MIILIIFIIIACFVVGEVMNLGAPGVISFLAGLFIGVGVVATGYEGAGALLPSVVVWIIGLFISLKIKEKKSSPYYPPYLIDLDPAKNSELCGNLNTDGFFCRRTGKPCTGKNASKRDCYFSI
ncbi:MAG: hypothetical protein FWG90_07955 [Oscillospiraceae bacterium]|nr:hypothetical protein [Oscillospiraceae bacterium]